MTDPTEAYTTTHELLYLEPVQEVPSPGFMLDSDTMPREASDPDQGTTIRAGEAQGAPQGEDGLDTAQETDPGDEAISTWLHELHVAEMQKLKAKAERASAHNTEGTLTRKQQGNQPTTPEALSLATAARVENIRRRVLVAIGLTRYGNPPFDAVAQSFLEQARSEVSLLPDAELPRALGAFYDPGRSQHKKLSATPEQVQREGIAWERAKKHAQGALMEKARDGVTLEELAAETENTMRRASENTGRLAEPTDMTVRVVDDGLNRVPSSAFFSDRGKSPLSLKGWSELPTRPIILPEGRPEPGAQGLATFLFDRIIYAPQVCDRQGRQVGLSPEVRDAYIAKVRSAVEDGTPIIASEYVPLIAIGNPIKRNTQGVSLAEVDFFRRLAEISQAIELYYEPGMHWLIGNEAPAFQGPEFHLPDNYVKQFHADCEAIVQQIDPEGRRLSLFNLADVLVGTPERADEWRMYKHTKTDQLQEAYTNPDHPHHAEVVRYLKTFTYPMATCINPYHFDSAEGLSSGHIAQVYSALKTHLGSGVRGVGASTSEDIALHDLSPQQQALFAQLNEWGQRITFKYRTVMDSRASLSAFNEVIPPHTLAHTIVTKRDKLVLYPNSGRGAYFPAHGEAIYLKSQAPEQRSAVTVRPWWQIAAQPDRYRPMHIAEREEPFYFEEVR